MIKSLSATDFCLFETLYVPLERLGLVWLCGTNHDTDAATSNGSGKSTVFKALGWCLYGKALDGEDGDKVIHEGKKRATVSVRLEGGWEVERSRSKGSPRLILRKDGTPVDAGKKELQERIDRIIGADWDTFRSVALYGQDDRRRFARPTTTDQDRKAVLHHILRTGELETAREVMKGEAARLRGEVDGRQITITTLRHQMNEHDPKALKVEADEWERRRNQRVKAHKRLAQEHKERAKAIQAEASALPEVKKRLKAAKQRRTDARAAEREWINLSAEVRRSEAGLKALDDQIEAAAEHVNELQDAIDRTKRERTCSACGQKIPPAKIREQVAQLRATREKRAEEYKAKSAEIDVARAKLAEQKAQLAARLAGIEDTGALDDEIEELQERRAKLDQTRERAMSELRAAHTEVEQARAFASEDNPYLQQLSKARERRKECRERIKLLKQEIREFNTELAHAEFWIRGFGPSGLPSFMLDSAMPLLTERSNEYLDTLSDGSITLEFSTQKELKSSKGEFRDKIDISWEIEGVEGYAPSGGQWKKIDLAVDFALGDLAETKTAAGMNLLCLDECLDGLDAAGRERVLKLLHELRSRRDTIFVISHDDLSELFERQLHVVKRDGVSTAELT